MNSSPSNPNLRYYSQSTCTLSIEDKKSPFPTWMNFNKPNPLKFSLELKDADRPEQTPTKIVGDRVKLDALHHAVDYYVGNLLAKAPLPQLNVPSAESPSASIESIDAINPHSIGANSTVQVDRPIDALQMTGELPHVQADGLSQHLLYLGNMANGDQVMVSLSTIQLFDLASTLAAGVAQTDNVADIAAPANDEAPAVIAPPLSEAMLSDQLIESEVVTPSAFASRADGAEPRVVLPSAKDKKSSEDPDSSSPDSWLQDDPSRIRFKEANAGANKLNLPKFPDISDSPLTSVWPWLGIGTVAAGIIAFSIFGNKVNNRPAVIAQNSPSPVPTSSIDTGVYQPAPVPTPSGLTPSPNISIGLGTPSLSSSLPPTIGNPNFSGIPGSSTSGLPAASIDRNVASGLGSGPSLRAPSQVVPSQAPTTSGIGRGKFSGLRPTQPRQSGLLPVIPNPATIARDPAGISDPRFTLPPTTSTVTPNNSELATRKPANNGNGSTNFPQPRDASTPGPVASADTDLFGPIEPRTSSAPVNQLPADNSKPLEFPANNVLDSPQARETQSYFQKRWKGDPNFSETLQYVIRVDKNGKVGSITPQGGISQNYLDKTRFLRPGDKLASPNASGKDQDVRVLLKPSGDVETLVEP